MVANADAAYSNATSYTDSKIATANSAIVANASAAYSNSVSYTDTKIATANLAIANAYSNAVSYTDAQIGIANSSITSNASAAYSNAVSYTDTKIATANLAIANAYSNAVSYTDSKIATANSEMAANVSAAYSNAVSYTDSKIATANSAIVANAGAAYSNATSYTDSKISTANSAIVANASAAYSNSVTYTDSKISTANSAMVANAATAYSNSVTYTDSKIATANAAITANASAAYSNATTYSSNASNVNTGTLAEARLPYRMNQNVRNTDSVTFNGMTLTGNLVVSGNVNIIGANNLSLVDNMIYLNANSTVTNPDLGFAGNYNDGTYRHTGFFRDATDGFWKVFDNYGPEPDASPYIDTSNSTFRIANFWANTIYVGNTSVYATVNTTNFTGTANNSSYLGGISKTQIFNNMGNNHSTYTDFNTIDDFGFRYVQGSTNGPGTGSSQFYGMTLGLGNEHAFSSYAYQIAFPRYLSTDNYISMRNREGGTWSSWTKIAAGVADAPSGSVFAASGSLRAPIFYDSDNTSFYADLTSTSDSIISAGNIRLGSRLVFNACDAFTGGSYALIGLSWGGAAGTYKNFAVYDYPNTREMFTVAGDTRNVTMFGSVTTAGQILIGPNSSSAYTRIGGNGGATDHATLSASNGNLHIDSKAGNGLYLNHYSSGIIYASNGGGYFYGYNSVRSPIFYDADDTSYYFGNGSGSANLSSVYANDWFRAYGATGLYSQSYGNHWYSTDSGYWSHGGNGSRNYGGIRLFSGHESGIKGFIYWDGNGFGLLNSSGNWQLRMEYGNANMELYNITYLNDARPYIIYDRNDTGYYVNPNDVSYLVEPRMAWRSLIGTQSYDGCLYDGGFGFRPGITIRGNYPHLNLVSSGINNTSHGPTLRFMAYDTAGATSGNYKHWVIGTSGTNAVRLSIGYASNNANPHEGIYGWGSVAMWFENDSNVYCNASIRPTIMYDRNDTGYYCDPNGTSFLNVVGLGTTGYEGRFQVYNGGTVAASFMGGWGQYGKVIQLRTDGAGGQDGPMLWFHKAGAKHWACGIRPYSGDNSFWISEDSYNGSWGSERLRLEPGGNLLVTGNVTAYWSDRRLKKNVETLENSIDVVKKLRGVIFQWNETGKGIFNGSDEPETGFIAQEVQEHIPSAVRENKLAKAEDGSHYLTIDQDKIVPYLVEAIKEQQEMIETMKQEMSDLKKLINS
jgi:hypothetical protein